MVACAVFSSSAFRWKLYYCLSIKREDYDSKLKKNGKEKNMSLRVANEIFFFMEKEMRMRWWNWVAERAHLSSCWKRYAMIKQMLTALVDNGSQAHLAFCIIGDFPSCTCMEMNFLRIHFLCSSFFCARRRQECECLEK